MVHILCILFGIIFFQISMFLYKNKFQFVVQSILIIAGIWATIVVLKLSIIYSILLYIIFPEAYTDFKEKKILNFNSAFLYLLLPIFVIIYTINKQIVLQNIAAAIIAMLVGIFLNKFGGLGKGDIALFVPLAFLFKENLLLIICIGLSFTFLYFLIRRFFLKIREENVALVPGVFIGVYIYIIISALLKSSFICI